MGNRDSELEQSSSAKRWAWHIVPGMLAAVAALALPLTLYAHRPILASCLMVGVVAQLDEEDLVSIAAYAASLPP